MQSSDVSEVHVSLRAPFTDLCAQFPFPRRASAGARGVELSSKMAAQHHPFFTQQSCRIDLHQVPRERGGGRAGAQQINQTAQTNTTCMCGSEWNASVYHCSCAGVRRSLVVTLINSPYPVLSVSSSHPCRALAGDSC